MRIYVLHTDIERGTRGLSFSSPVELAVRRQTGYVAEVRDGVPTIFRNGPRGAVALPPEAVEAVRRWDATGSLTPFAFELMIPGVG